MLLQVLTLVTLCLTPVLGQHCPPGSGEMSCKSNPSANVCSSAGDCICDGCDCHCRCNQRAMPWEVLSGRYCECTNFLCDRYDGQICGGPDRGECVCNQCRCKPGWTGPNCSCEDSNKDCIDPDQGEECSRNGHCQCNRCTCYETAGGRYSGKYCEECPTCLGKCVKFKDCVECLAFNLGPYNEEDCKNKCSFDLEIRDELEKDNGDRMCTFFDEDDCRYFFSYRYDDGRRDYRVMVQRTRECPNHYHNKKNLQSMISSGGRSFNQFSYFEFLTISIGFIILKYPS